MIVRVNGSDTVVPDGTTVSGLIESMGLDGRRVAAEIDGSICPRASWGSEVLREGQRVELVGFVGGG